MSPDREREEWMELLQVEGPSPCDIQNWQRALLARQLQKNWPRKSNWSQIAVAASIGFVVGLTAMAKVPHSTVSFHEEKNTSSNATIESVYTKLE